VSRRCVVGPHPHGITACPRASLIRARDGDVRPVWRNWCARRVWRRVFLPSIRILCGYSVCIA
jgi:hypothetical protein